MVKHLMIFLIFVLMFKFIILNEIFSSSSVKMNVSIQANKQIGKKGAAVFIVENELYFDIDTKRETIFKTNISDENNNNMEVWCGPWVSSQFFIFCELNETIPKGKYFFQFNNTFNYLGYEIYLTSESVYNITKLDSDIIDIYSEPQTINVNDKQDKYELRYKIKSYNYERLYLSIIYDIPLNCQRKNNELICSIKKTVLEGYSTILLEYMKHIIIMFPDKNGEFNGLFLISPITFEYKVQKKDVYVKIIKLLTSNVENQEMIAYETNVTNIPTIMTSSFKLAFLGEDGEQNLTCHFKNGEFGPLLLLCKPENEGYLALEEIKNDTLQNNINTKYNFIIQPVNNNEIIKATSFGNYYPITSIYPNILDFTSKDLYTIDIVNEVPTSLDQITFNEEKEDLKCEDLIHIKRCNISKDHFKGKENGYYYIKYFNHNLNRKTTSFSTIPISVILTKENNTKKTERNSKKRLIYVFSIIAVFFFLVIITIFIIACYYKIKNADLKEEVLKTSFKEIE